MATVPSVEGSAHGGIVQGDDVIDPVKVGGHPGVDAGVARNGAAKAS